MRAEWLRRVWVGVLVVMVSGCADRGSAEVDGAGEDESHFSMPNLERPNLGQPVEMPEDPCSRLADGATCDDGNRCTMNDVCEKGVCVGGAEESCAVEGMNPCLHSVCHPIHGCLVEPAADGSACNAPCFGGASCQAGTCEPDMDTAVVCDQQPDPNSCVASYQCDPSTGQCRVPVPRPAGSVCDTDGDRCATLELCSAAGQCVDMRMAKPCGIGGDGNACHDTRCEPQTGACVSTGFAGPVSCDDGDPCTENDRCSQSHDGRWARSHCKGAPVEVDDADPCTEDMCIDGQVLNITLTSPACQVPTCGSTMQSISVPQLPPVTGKADIILIVDNSGSMSDEITETQDLLNAFSQTITGMNVDHRVVLLSWSGDPGVGFAKQSTTAPSDVGYDMAKWEPITVPAPLGGSAEFLQVDTVVLNGALLSSLVDHYEDYSTFLRPEASTHIIVITDDESHLAHEEFSAFVEEHTLIANPTVHSIVAWAPKAEALVAVGKPAGKGCPSGARYGQTYIELANESGGFKGSVCTQDWDVLYDGLAGQVVDTTSFSCQFALPMPAALVGAHGVAVSRVSATSSSPLFEVSDGGACFGADAFYFDDAEAPTTIHLCPSACEKAAESVIEIHGSVCS